MGYRELAPPPRLRELVECEWTRTGPAEPARILPDGCMDLIWMEGRFVVAGPDSSAYLSASAAEPIGGLRFRPGVLPRLLGVPAHHLRNTRIPLADVRTVRGRSLVDIAVALAAGEPRSETAPWPLPVLDRVTARLASGAAVSAVAREAGWSERSLQRQCAAVYGYGPATLRRILRFRRAMGLLGEGLPAARVAARAGYADQPHLYREVRALAGVPLGQLARGANRSTQLPSGSDTVA
ncbi:helix-turn-helix domain-containing protein [Mycolicibacterium litorale]|uniref:AraC family transcriptional regulator n=1 Tax=Mycolicibacterium litorale TaxID=758802 RepID=A0AAD1MX40_9MYCO|nr:helix-turn-helix domain-containing protein [Mycolicibacterium litorale]MCV7418164.1 AraC family transcriptional regulator [Mycolicibacterium litorale]TDY06446.1 AraC-like DNA-binding protein [Mycolicibacterium litorale]BBY19408.1 AraC family transcriptional regulator [Mycolicibacterium litorale]